MLLLTLNEWLGPSRHRDPKSRPVKSIERHIAFATRLDITMAMRALLNYKDAYNVRFYPHMAINFTLLSISEIPNPVPDAALFDALGVSLIENLSIDETQDFVILGAAAGNPV